MTPRDDSAPGAPVDEGLMQFLYRAPIGLVQTTLDGTIVMINPMSAQLLMPLAPDGSLLNLFDVLQPLAPQLRTLAAASEKPGDLICDSLPMTLPRRLGPNGQPFVPQTLALHLMRLDEATLMACVSDITVAVQRDALRLAEQLDMAERTDSLTSLPNRVAALESIEHALGQQEHEPGRRCAVLVVNADRFAGLNVAYGQAVGDEVIRLMARRIDAVSCARASAASSPPLVARLGGDEFLVLFDVHRSSLDGIHALARTVTDALGQPCAIGEHLVHIAVSVGAAVSLGSNRDAESMLQDAGLAMREAKRAGGACYRLFEPSMMDLARQRAALENELRVALAGEQLFVVYQPIIDLANGTVAGMEALVRWRHPERGMVMPTEFIPVAEETGLICLLGEWVLNEACRQLVDWKARLGRKAPRTMSVNLSRAQIVEPNVVERVARSLATSGLPAAELQLEVTESLAAQGRTIQLRLQELKALGLTLALDDFGTGYSSLASLHELPIDTVKIDRSFVSPLESSAHHRVLIEAVVMVARSLGMTTVAEGIETAVEAAALTALGCDKGQGYHYAKPMAGDAATAWLTARGTST